MISLIEQLINYEPLYIIAVIAAYILALLFSLALHEWAHAFVAYKQGDETPRAFGRLTLNPLAHIDIMGMVCLLFFRFGWAKPVPVNPLKFKSYRKGMFLVSIAGIAMNITLVVIGSFFYALLYVKIGEPQTILEIFGVNFFSMLTFISFTLAVFNLIPIYPLDGFKILQSCVKGQNKVLRFLEQYGNYIMLAFIISPIFSIILSFLESNLLIPLLNLWVALL
jgi:Zn-dependent protease